MEWPVRPKRYGSRDSVKQLMVFVDVNNNDATQPEVYPSYVQEIGLMLQKGARGSLDLLVGVSTPTAALCPEARSNAKSPWCRRSNSRWTSSPFRPPSAVDHR